MKTLKDNLLLTICNLQDDKQKLRQALAEAARYISQTREGMMDTPRHDEVLALANSILTETNYKPNE